MKKHVALAVAVLSVLLCGVAGARTKLVTLPGRDATTVRLDNPDATLVEEERVLTLQQGTNEIDFSWKGVQIDENSIRIKMLDHADQVNLLSVSYPPEGSSLVWTVYSEGAWEETVRISYLLGNLDRLITYRALATEDESSLDFNSHVVLRNFSGEDFESARCVLDYGQSFSTGLQHGETKRVLFMKQSSVPITKEFTWDAAKKPHDPEKVDGNVGIPLRYVVKNDAESGLGQNPLWGGKVRIFQKDGHGSTVFLGEDRAEFTPVGDSMKLYVGDSRDIVVTQRRMSSEQVNVRTNDNGQPVVYDMLVRDKVIIENFRDKPVTLRVIEHIPGQWEEVEFSHSYERKDHSTIEFSVQVPAATEEPAETVLNMRYRLLNIFANQYRQFNRLQSERPVPRTQPGRTAPGGYGGGGFGGGYGLPSPGRSR